MTKLTTERLEKKIKSCIEIENCEVMMPLSAAQELLAFRNAAKNPIAWVVGDEEIADFKNGREVCVMRDCDDEQLDYLPLYADPVLPKQPELIGVKVSIDTGSDNIGHRLFGEIVGTSDSNGVPVLCIEVAENNADVAAPAQPAMPVQEIVGWIFEDELPKNYPYDAMFVHSKVDVVRMFPVFAPSAAQPVSEPYKLPDGWKLVPEEATIAMLTLIGLTGSFDFMQQKYKNMLAAAPAQESE